MRRFLFFLFALAATVGDTVSAQTNDHVYRGFSFEEDPGSPRAAGLAGAFTAIADDASATVSNPAGLASHNRSEAMGTLLRRSPGSSGPGDSLAGSTSPGLLGGTLALGTRFALGATFGEPREVNVRLAPETLPDATYDAGALDARVRTLGFGAAYRVTERLRLGAGVAWSQLELSSQASVLRTRGDTLTQIETSASDSAVTASFGGLFALTKAVTLGLAGHTGGSWQVGRTAYSPAEGRTVDHGSVYGLRTPDVYSAAVALRLPRSFRISGQADFVRYSQIREGLDIRRGLDAADYVLDDGFEARFALEWARSFRPLTLQLRGGLWSQAPNSIAYVGPDPSERSTFRGSDRRLREGVGASALFKSGLSIDVGALFGGDRSLLLAGARYRF